jgi:aspartate/methionine/tyrosine aminotransferase
VVTHSFSKSFLMTGWRLGWLVLPPAMTHGDGQADRVQHLLCQRVHAARRAWRPSTRTDEITPRVVAHLKAVPRRAGAFASGAVPGVQVAMPAKGGMYAFFQLDGFGDSLEVAKRLVV